MKLTVATRNKGKMREISEELSGLPFEVVLMQDAGFKGSITEDGKTFRENALIKAGTVFQALGTPVIADDSGLEVDFLEGAPGVLSARFAGEDASDVDRNRKLLQLLRDVPYKKRTARFVCEIAVVIGSIDKAFTIRGECEGVIAEKPSGENGFGYDPVFYLPEYGCTMAQLERSEKNRISHRGKALKQLKEKLKQYNCF